MKVYVEKGNQSFLKRLKKAGIEVVSSSQYSGYWLVTNDCQWTSYETGEGLVRGILRYLKERRMHILQTIEKLEEKRDENHLKDGEKDPVLSVAV